MHTHSTPRLATVGGRLVTAGDTKKQVQKVLKEYGIRVQEASLSNLESSTIKKNVVLVPRKQSSFLIVPVERSKDLLTGLRRCEIPMRFTTLRAAGITIEAIFGQRILDSILIEYCWEEVAVVVSVNRFLEARG